MKKKLLFIVAIVLPIMAAAVIKAYNTNRLSLGDVSLANIEALANTESTACQNASHCTKDDNYSCFYYVVTADNNKMTYEMKGHIHQGVD